MAQADQTVQNTTFPTVRADINDNLAALFSNNSGSIEPLVNTPGHPPAVAYMDWIDTSGTDAVWKKRNAANNAWITLGTIDGNDIAFEGTLPDQSGNAGEFLTTDGTDASWAAIFSLTAGTSVASTSGTSIDFTGIPSYVKRVTVMFNGVSTNGTSNWLIQLGTASGIESTNYTSYSAQLGVSAVAVGATYTAGFGVAIQSAAALASGQVSLVLLGSNTWTASGLLARSDTVNGLPVTGSKTLSGTLDRIRITTVNGTDTFDAGSINILYEG